MQLMIIIRNLHAMYYTFVTSPNTLDHEDWYCMLGQSKYCAIIQVSQLCLVIP